MEKELIIKALECCTRGRKSNEDRPCLECPYNECNIVGGTSERQTSGTCQGWLMKDALALIKELTVELDAMRGAANSYKMHNGRLTEENERLGKAMDTMVVEHKRLITIAKSDTVKEMQENLNELLYTIPTVYNSHFRKLIPQVVERMLKENV